MTEVVKVINAHGFASRCFKAHKKIKRHVSLSPGSSNFWLFWDFQGKPESDAMLRVQAPGGIRQQED